MKYVAPEMEKMVLLAADVITESASNKGEFEDEELD